MPAGRMRDTCPRNMYGWDAPLRPEPASLCWYNLGYTEVVKTAVSMPDDLFRLAESAARRLGMSRSELYRSAVTEYLKQRLESDITERLNQVYSRRPAKLEPGFNRAQLKSLEKDVW